MSAARDAANADRLHRRALASVIDALSTGDRVRLHVDPAHRPVGPPPYEAFDVEVTVGPVTASAVAPVTAYSDDGRSFTLRWPGGAVGRDVRELIILGESEPAPIES